MLNIQLGFIVNMVELEPKRYRPILIPNEGKLREFLMSNDCIYFIGSVQQNSLVCLYSASRGVAPTSP